jgi:alkylation response protein AidB-like acyl-CoA dehydrogenase
MPNFYTDNDDILFHMKNMDLDRVIALKEKNFADKGKYDYAPKNIADAKDSYKRIMDVVGDISGNIIDPRAAEVDEEGAHYADGEVTYAKGTSEALEACKKADLNGFTLPRRYDGLKLPYDDVCHGDRDHFHAQMPRS